jgi:catechol 2,3-dioxygenase-like lactoylglutathione lyase family enzyme
MITGLDHVLIVCTSVDEAENTYSALLGREPDWRSSDPGGSSTVIFQMENMALEIMAPHGGGPLARRLHTMLEQEGIGLKSLIFSSDNLADDRATFDRRALKPDEISAGESVNPFAGTARSWSRFRLDEQATHGVRIFALARKPDDPMVYKLDRSNPDWDMRLIFFRVGGLTVEIAHKLSGGPGNQPDKLWGLSWKTPDIEATHARLMAANYAVTSIRSGRRAGTRVFSVRDGTMGVPTLVISESAP